MKADHIIEALTGDSGWRHMLPQVDGSDFPTQWMPLPEPPEVMKDE